MSNSIAQLIPFNHACESGMERAREIKVNWSDIEGVIMEV